MQSYLSGRVDVSINKVKIPAKLLSDEGVVTTLKEGMTEIKTMAGNFNQPNGTLDEATCVFTVVLPNMDYIKNIAPDLYTASTDRPTLAGQVVFGGNTCVERNNTPVVVHYTCQANSDNDVYIPNGSVQFDFELTQNVSDPVTVKVTVNAMPDDGLDGAVAILGTGDLDEPTTWNATSEAYEAIGS